MEELKAIDYVFPEKEIREWQTGQADLPQELKDNKLSFLMLNSENNRIEISKNGSIDLDFALKCFESIKEIIPKLKNDGNSFEAYVHKIRIRGSRNKGHIIIQFTCVYFTLDNFNYIIEQLN